VEDRGHAALARARVEPARAVATREALDDAVRVGRRLADVELGPVGRVGNRRRKEAVLDHDLVGLEQVGRLHHVFVFDGPEVVAGGGEHHRRALVAVMEDEALLELEPVGRIVIGRLLDGDLEAAIAWFLGGHFVRREIRLASEPVGDVALEVSAIVARIAAGIGHGGIDAAVFCGADRVARIFEFGRPRRLVIVVAANGEDDHKRKKERRAGASHAGLQAIERGGFCKARTRTRRNCAHPAPEQSDSKPLLALK
jgi:hypothetical protein